MRERAADLRDVCECISGHLTGRAASGAARYEPRVVCAADLSPARVIQLAQDGPLAFVIEQGADTSHVSVCGEAAADPRAIALLIGMGVTELSVRPSAIANVKAQVRRIERAAARGFAEAVAALPSVAAVAARIEAAREAETGIDVREARNSR